MLFIVNVGLNLGLPGLLVLVSMWVRRTSYLTDVDKNVIWKIIVIGATINSVVMASRYLMEI